jgi:hypothetical protein
MRGELMHQRVGNFKDFAFKTLILISVHTREKRAFTRYLSCACVLILLAGCSSDVSGPANQAVYIPKVGSAFTMRVSIGSYDTTMDRVIAQSGVVLDGKSNVVRCEDGLQFSSEANGDVSLRYDGKWLTLPIGSRKDIILDSSRQTVADGSYLVADRRTSFTGQQTRSIDGKTLESFRAEYRSISKLYDADGKLVASQTEINRYSWAPEIGFFTLIEQEKTDVPSISETLIAYKLK